MLISKHKLINFGGRDRTLGFYILQLSSIYFPSSSAAVQMHFNLLDITRARVAKEESSALYHLILCEQIN